MNVRRTLLFAGVIAAAASTQPEPASANGNGAGIALGIIGGIIAGAAAANANRPQQPYYPQPPAYADNSAACQSWLAVLNDPRYDAATRAQAERIVSDCGLPHSSGGGPSSTAGYPGASECAAWQATLEDHQRYGISPAVTDSASEIVARCNRGPSATAYAPTTTAPTTSTIEIPLFNVDSRHHAIKVAVNGMTLPFVLDTGAGSSQITPAMAARLAAQGLLTNADLGGMTEVSGVGGGTRQRQVMLSITIGGRTIPIEATIGSPDVPPLLGQDVLRHFRSYTIDNKRGVLVLG